MENTTKCRLLYLYRYLIENTDPEHTKSTLELIIMLQVQYGLSVSRNTISNDLSTLCACDSRIRVIHSTQNKYYFDGQIFQTPEIKLLIDAVSSSRFITERNSKALIEKLVSLTTPNVSATLKRNIHVQDRVKSENECGYYIIDAISEAITTEHMISFLYTDYDINKKLYTANNGLPYTVSPYDLIWDGDYYYLHGFCCERQSTRTFRLDRIKRQPQILSTSIIPKTKDYDSIKFGKSVFRMYDTEKTSLVSLLCTTSCMKYIIDHFGTDIKTTPVNDNSFKVQVEVCTSPTFYRWIFGFCGDIKILGPESTLNEYRNMVKKALE